MVDATVLLPPSKHVINRKASERFLGPYKAIGRIAPESFVVNLPPTSRAH